MSFGDFKGIWKIIHVFDTARDFKGDWIAIGGNEQAVQVVCIHHRGHGYEVGTYQPAGGEEPERIEGPETDPYSITLSNGTMTCDNLIGLKAPGTWIAEDNLGQDYPHGGE